MKRRSKAGGKPAKRRKTVAVKHRNAPKAERSPSDAAQETVFARLARELNESREQQTATSDVLRVISSSQGDLERVFDSLLKNATRLCRAKFGNLYLSTEDGFRYVAMHGVPSEYAEMATRYPVGVGAQHRHTPLSRMARTKKVVNVPNLTLDKSYTGNDPRIVALVETAGARTIVVVPMLKDDELIGAIAIYRQEVQPFTDEQVNLLQNFAAQAVIAIENTGLLNELRQRTTDLTEALEQRTATSEVLRVISASPGALGPVFQSMLENATRICDAAFGSMLLRDGDVYRRVALHNAPRIFSEFSKNAPILKRAVAPSADRVFDTKQVIHVFDLEVEEPDAPISKFGGARTLLNVPMLKENEAIGLIGIYRQEVRSFTDKQIALLTNFATQAVIAIENARLINELRERTDQFEAQSNEGRQTKPATRTTRNRPSRRNRTHGKAAALPAPSGG